MGDDVQRVVQAAPASQASSLKLLVMRNRWKTTGETAMKVFRVVTQRDGPTVKAPGVSETEVRQIDRRYVAETMQQVWDEITSIREDPEEDLVAIIEEHTVIVVVPHNAIAQGRAEAGEARCSESPGATGYTAFGRDDE